MADEVFTLVSVLDPGIDTERMTTKDMRAYVDTRDVNLIRPFYKPGAQVTEYTCREVPHSLWERFVMATDSEPERHLRAFRAGVMSVKNLPQRDRTVLPSYEPARSADILDDAVLARFSPAERAEIGLVVWQRSFLAPRTAPAYQLPGTVVECLAVRAFRLAESSPTAPEAKSSSEASSPSAETPATPSTTDPQLASSGDGSAPAGDATATERTTVAA